MPLARSVNLFGGPYHGQIIAVPVGQDHVHVTGYEAPEHITAEDAEGPATVRTRRGTYSQVSGPDNRDNFEWDGWDPK